MYVKSQAQERKRRPRASNGQRFPLPCNTHFGKWETVLAVLKIAVERYLFLQGSAVGPKGSISYRMGKFLRGFLTGTWGGRGAGARSKRGWVSRRGSEGFGDSGVGDDWGPMTGPGS